MSGKKASEARHAERAGVPPVRSPKKAHTQSFWRSWKGGLVAAGVVAVVAASFVLPGAFDEQSTPAAAHDHAGMAASSEGDGLPAGSAVPAFAEQDVESGQAITAKSLRGRKTLLFFSEGVMCQACFEQIRGSRTSVRSSASAAST